MDWKTILKPVIIAKSSPWGKNRTFFGSLAVVIFVASISVALIVSHDRLDHCLAETRIQCAGLTPKVFIVAEENIPERIKVNIDGQEIQGYWETAYSGDGKKVPQYHYNFIPGRTLSKGAHELTIEATHCPYHGTNRAIKANFTCR